MNDLTPVRVTPHLRDTMDRPVKDLLDHPELQLALEPTLTLTARRPYAERGRLTVWATEKYDTEADLINLHPWREGVDNTDVTSIEVLFDVVEAGTYTAEVQVLGTDFTMNLQVGAAHAQHFVQDGAGTVTITWYSTGPEQVSIGGHGTAETAGFSVGFFSSAKISKS